MCWMCDERRAAEAEGRIPDFAAALEHKAGNKTLDQILDGLFGVHPEEAQGTVPPTGEVSPAAQNDREHWAIEIDQAKAEVNLTNAKTVDLLSQAAKRLYEINEPAAVKRVLGVINVLTATDEEAPSQATPGVGKPDGYDDQLDALPPELRKMLDAFKDAGIDVEVMRFPKA